MNINLITDNRVMDKITLRQQLAQLWAHDLVTNWDQIKQLTMNGIKAAFLPEIEKQNILKEAEKEFNNLEMRFTKTIISYLKNDARGRLKIA